MLTIKKVFTFLSTLPVWAGIGNTALWKLLKQISKLVSQMNAQVFSVPGLAGEKEGLFRMEKHKLILCYELSLHLTCRVNANYYKSVHHPILRKNREHPGNFQNQ